MKTEQDIRREITSLERIVDAKLADRLFHDSECLEERIAALEWVLEV